MNVIVLIALAVLVYFAIRNRLRAQERETASTTELAVPERKSLRWTIRIIAWILWIPICILAFGASIVMIESATGYRADPYSAPTGFFFQAVWILVFFAGFPVISRLTQRIGNAASGLRSRSPSTQLNETGGRLPPNTMSDGGTVEVASKRDEHKNTLEGLEESESRAIRSSDLSIRKPMLREGDGGHVGLHNPSHIVDSNNRDGDFSHPRSTVEDHQNDGGQATLPAATNSADSLENPITGESPEPLLGLVDLYESMSESELRDRYRNRKRYSAAECRVIEWAHNRRVREITSANENACANEVVIDVAEFDDVCGRAIALIASVGTCPDPFKTGSTENPHHIEAFDLNTLLSVFPRVHIHDKYVLDYVYWHNGRGGEPFPYARKNLDPPINNVSEYRDRYGFPSAQSLLIGAEPTTETIAPVIQHVDFEKTPEGYFQLAIFLMLHRRFYLFWHSNYNKRVFHCDAASVAGYETGISEYLDRENIAWDDFVRISRPRVITQSDSVIIRVLSEEDMGKGITLLEIATNVEGRTLSLSDIPIAKPKLQTLY